MRDEPSHVQAVVLFEELKAGNILAVEKYKTNDLKFWRHWGGLVLNSDLTRPEKEDLFRSLVSSFIQFHGKYVEYILGFLCQELTKKGWLSLMDELIAMSERLHLDSEMVRSQRAKWHFRSGQWAQAKETVLLMAGTKNIWTVYGALELGLALHDLDVLTKFLAVGERLNNPAIDSILEEARRFVHLESTLHSTPSPIPIYCLSLDRDEHRFNSLESVYQKIDSKIIRQPGVSGNALPDALLQMLLRGRRLWSEGEADLAIWIGMARIWERTIESNQPHTLVLEDDGFPNASFRVDDVLDQLPKDYDFCLVNDRVYPSWTSSYSKGRKVIPLRESLHQFGVQNRAPGTDGYIVSQNGAKKLLEIFREGPLAKSSDWVLYAHGVGRLEDPNVNHYKRINKIIERTSSKVEFKAFISTIPLVVHRPLGFSSKNHGNYTPFLT